MKRLVVALSTTLLALAFAIPSAKASSSPPAGTPTIEVATGERPTHTGPAPSSYGYLPLHPDFYAQAKAAANAQANISSKRRPGGGGGGPTISTYSNVTPSFQGTYQTQLAPPDTTGAIGPDRYIETINTKFVIYNRTGSSIGSGSLASLTNIPSLPNNDGCFFQGSAASHSDPQMMWDNETQRFYYVDVWYDGTFLSCAGVSFGYSTTSTPAGASDFCHYRINTGGTLFDYPKLGDSKNFLEVGYNKFSGGGSSYDGSEIMTINKPPSGSTCAAATAFGLVFHGTGTQATPVPANLVDDSNGTGYVVANPDLTVGGHSASTISLYTVSWNGSSVDGSSRPVPTFGGPITVSVPSYSLPSNAPEKGTTALIDTLDGRFEAAVAAIDPAAGGVRIWTAHAVFGSNPGIGAEERWYEINPSGSLTNHGAAASSSLFIWNGAISSDRSASSGGSFGSSFAMSVSTSSSTTYPAIQFVTGVRSGGVLTQSALNNLAQATGKNVDFTCSPCRWGDYSGASPDPAATGTVGKVWLANQTNVASSTSSDTDWRTWIFGVIPT
jgi:hypothetical protein